MIQEAHAITIFKNAFYIPIAYLGISHNAIAALTILILIDTALGILAAHAIGGKIKSSILAGGLVSKLVLLLVPMSIALAGKGIGYELDGLVGASISILVLSETYSIIGNIIQIRKKEKVDEQDAVHISLVYLRKTVLRILGEKMR